MALPQIDTSMGSILVTVLLWFWTLKRSRVHLFQQENMLRQQNRAASWAFFLCLNLQMITLLADGVVFSFSMGIACSAVFLLFLLASHHQGEGFWSKRRNQLLAGLVASSQLCLLSVVLKDLYLIPILTALLVANICQRRFVVLFSNSLRDLEALQAKLIKQEAKIHNSRQNDPEDSQRANYLLQENQIESRA
ncbi:MAG: hypothetical protein ACOH5I_01895 [Oligoflexus sp.]